MVMDISIVIVCMCLLTLVLCKELYTNSKSQLIKLFSTKLIGYQIYWHSY
jgi:hypothetical protein